MSSSPLPLLEINQTDNSFIAMSHQDRIIGSTNQQRGHARERGNASLRRSGIYLTWEDLCVRVSKGKDDVQYILQGLFGYAWPGEVLAIMGPSGCGKSTLLDALAGRLDPKANQTGEILINGRRQQLAYGTSAYVTQDDVLTWTLTVREVVYYSAQLQLPSSMSVTEKKERVETTIKEMGLQDAMNTKIGKSGKKGLSSGQKRRVSICMEILTRPKLLFLDEPTSGLDSAASYYVMKQIVKLAQQNGMTVIAAIHQPNSEVFELFRNLCLISLGRIVYFGPRDGASEFFAFNGFPCPSHQNPSDHFLKTINKDFAEDIELSSGVKITSKEAIDMLVRSYKSSDTYRQTQRLVAEIGAEDGEALRRGSRVDVISQCFILSKRSLVNMHRDVGYYWVRLLVNVALSFGLGTMFHDVSSAHNPIQARGSMLMFVASFITMMAIGSFPSFVDDMKVFRRERLNGHYSAGAFVISNALSSIPYLLIISLIPGAIMYFLVGLQKGYEQFIFFSLTLFVCTMLVESLMMIVATILPDFFMGLVAGAGIQGLMMLGGGFFQLPNDLPIIFWKYPLYFIAFHKYAFQALYKNEYEGLTFPHYESGQGTHTITGEEVLTSVWQIKVDSSKWVDLGVLFGMVVIYRLLFLTVLTIRERFKPAVFPKNIKQVVFDV